ncbi:efflux RND transporter permease subunit [uncultured Jannaschia sp.]|uniref:efflux RND transporter permease subunit n=1 Tax=uncultured Jannaschia sp. TaxID=293347 RepID=UPI0026259366|nr:efflux RND transporter permease subunit [uncultured Jannaschia sp.]
MIGIVDWAAGRARMVLAFVALSLLAGGLAYWTLPKEGEPDIDIPGLFISVPFPGISASDSEKLLVKPMETRLKEIDGLETMLATAAEGYAGLFLEFEFGWDKNATIADVRDKMGQAEAEFPDGAEQYTISEINFSEFPILIVSLSGSAPERTLLRLADDLQDRLEAMPSILEAGLAGHRDEMLEVLIDPLALEAYNVTAGELVQVVTNNNLLVATGAVETASGAFPVKIPGSFETTADVYALPVKTDGDRVITLGDLAEVNLTYQDREGTARYNGETTVALQVVKRKGFNIIDTAAAVHEEIAAETAFWPDELRQAVNVTVTLDQSKTVESMVQQLEGSVLTAIALVMVVVLGTLGTRSALLVGFAIPTSFLLSFAIMAVVGITISNIVMFGLILAVGMLVDGAIVVVEYADKRISEGSGPMSAYTEAARRMFWPVISSTATTLCAFLPMLFWPGIAGEFMGMLPLTIIFVLSASLVVALVYLPVLGGVAGRMTRAFARASGSLRRTFGLPVRLVLVCCAVLLLGVALLQLLNPNLLLPAAPAAAPGPLSAASAVAVVAGLVAVSITLGAVTRPEGARRVRSGYRRRPFGRFIHLIVGNPVGPIVAIVTVAATVFGVFSYYGTHNTGVEFFVESELEQANIFIRARGNLSLDEKDALLQQAERIVLETPGIKSAFAFAGDGGLSSGGPADGPPNDTIGQIQIEMVRWEERPTVSEPWFTMFDHTFRRDFVDPAFDGDEIGKALLTRLRALPGIKVDLTQQERGPGAAKPIHLRLTGDDWDDLLRATADMRARFERMPGLIDVEDSLPLPGIDWEVEVDVEKAGRFGADVATVGAMVQLVTRGILLDTMRVDSSDDEIDIRMRLPESDRLLSTLDDLKVRTTDGLVPLANFITRRAVPRLAQIDRVDGQRFFDVKGDVAPDLYAASTADGTPLGVLRELGAEDAAGQSALRGTDGTVYAIISADAPPALAEAVADGRATILPVTADERIDALSLAIEAENLLPPTVAWEWTGDQEEQAESMAFLGQAFLGALGLMFVILLAQFNSFYNSVLVLIAVILSTTGVLIGMLVMDQQFSVIMTGTGIVALAGIVVNNNIVLIDTYQDYARYMPRLEAITRTAEDRIRPVLLTTLTTMAGLAPMMFGLSFDFVGGGYTIGSPTALWWIQLATAVVWGLGVATVLTLVLTPALLAARVWLAVYLRAVFRLAGRIGLGRASRTGADWMLRREARRIAMPTLLWAEDGADRSDVSGAGDSTFALITDRRGPPPLRAAE